MGHCAWELRRIVVEPNALFLLLGFAGLSGGVLVAELVVTLVELLALLLEGFQVQLLLLEFLAESGRFFRVHRGNSLAALAILASTLVGAETVLQAHCLDNHDVGAVENQRKEKRESAQVHVALGVKLASLDFGTFVAKDGAATKD